jgi:hypothetical protein
MNIVRTLCVQDPARFNSAGPAFKLDNLRQKLNFYIQTTAISIEGIRTLTFKVELCDLC